MPEKVRWLWGGWLPKGKLTVLAGGKTTGKSTICINWMATVTSGGLWPDGTRAVRGDVLIWSAEDDFEDTILPRFLAAGGDADRLFYVEGVLGDDDEKRSFDPARDMARLWEAACHLHDLQLAIIDPVVLVIPIGSDSHKNSETRRGLQPLVDFAVTLNVALLGVTHFSKGSADQSPIDRVTGSLAFGAVPRVVLAAAADQDGNRRRLVRVASNIGPSGNGFEFMLFQAPLPGHDFAAQRVDWGAQLTGSAKELLDTSKAKAQAAAAEFLSTFLANGPKPQREVKQAADAYCHTWATVRRAQQKLGIEPRKEGKSWLWELPQHKPNRDGRDGGFKLEESSPPEQTAREKAEVIAMARRAAAQQKNTEDALMRLLAQALAETQAAAVTYAVWRQYADTVSSIGEGGFARGIKRLIDKGLIEQHDDSDHPGQATYTPSSSRELLEDVKRP